MNDALYIQFIDERIKDGELLTALFHVGIEGILQEFECWLQSNFILTQK
jgi:hypothetical protein